MWQVPAWRTSSIQHLEEGTEGEEESLRHKESQGSRLTEIVCEGHGIHADG